MARPRGEFGGLQQRRRRSARHHHRACKRCPHHPAELQFRDWPSPRGADEATLNWNSVAGATDFVTLATLEYLKCDKGNGRAVHFSESRRTKWTTRPFRCWPFKNRISRQSNRSNNTDSGNIAPTTRIPCGDGKVSRMSPGLLPTWSNPAADLRYPMGFRAYLF